MVSDLLDSGDIFLGFSFDCLGLVNLFKRHLTLPQFLVVIPLSFWNPTSTT